MTDDEIMKPIANTRHCREQTMTGHQSAANAPPKLESTSVRVAEHRIIRHSSDERAFKRLRTVYASFLQPSNCADVKAGDADLSVIGAFHVS